MNDNIKIVLIFVLIFLILIHVYYKNCYTFYLMLITIILISICLFLPVDIYEKYTNQKSAIKGDYLNYDNTTDKLFINMDYSDLLYVSDKVNDNGEFIPINMYDEYYGYFQNSKANRIYDIDNLVSANTHNDGIKTKYNYNNNNESITKKNKHIVDILNWEKNNYSDVWYN